MKAKDLAALAALGVAGYAAYNKFGDKAVPASGVRPGATLGNSGSANDYSAGENEARDTFRSDARMRPDAEMSDEYAGMPAYQGRSANRLAEVQGMGDNFRSEGMRPDAAMPVSGGIGAQGREVLGRELRQPGQNWGGEGRARTAAPAAAEVVSKTRAFTPPGSQDAMGAFANAGQADAAAPKTRAFTPPGYVASANDYNRASAPNIPSNAALGDYARAINPAMQADRMAAAASPSARKTDALAVTSRANQAAYLAQKRAEQDRIDALRSSGGRRAKGGVVKKMASGGLATSKMSSKPKQSTASSRGDGIAQRGKTRGTLR
jgi:hypothetical protein